MLTFLCSLQNPPADIELLALEYPRKKELFRNRMSSIGVAQEIRDLILELRKHFKVGVVTSSNIREIGSILETAGLLPLLDTVVHGGEVKITNPLRPLPAGNGAARSLTRALHWRTRRPESRRHAPLVWMSSRFPMLPRRRTTTRASLPEEPVTLTAD